MKTSSMAAVLAALMAGTSSAETIGVSMQSFDNNFQTLLREGLDARASEVSGVNLQIEDAQTDISKQRSQMDNFIASGVDAIIMTLADTSAAPGISEAASRAGIPLVYLNLEPENLDRLPEKQVYVGSKETDSGRLTAEAACELLKKNGKVSDAQAYILMGDLAHQASRDRTSSVKETLPAGDCKGVTIADEQSAAWTRTNAPLPGRSDIRSRPVSKDRALLLESETVIAHHAEWAIPLSGYLRTLLDAIVSLRGRSRPGELDSDI